MSLVLHVTLANINCGAANDNDRIAAYQSGDTIALMLCGHPSSQVRFCIDQLLTPPSIIDYINYRSGNRVIGGKLHAGVKTTSAVGEPLVIIPTIDEIPVAGFQLEEPTDAYQPVTVHDLLLGSGLTLATSVA